MRDKGISSVYVAKSKKGYEKGQEPDIYPIGIVTERDILYRVVAENKGPYKVTIGEIMSSPIIAVDEGLLIKDAISLMRRKHIRRLLVTGTKKIAMESYRCRTKNQKVLRHLLQSVL